MWLALLVVRVVVSGASGSCASVNTPKEKRCTGCPPMYEGKMCASTTRYNDQTKAACGCGNSDPVPRDWWTLTQYTAALDCKNLDPVHPFNAWCPTGCGACYELCSTGGSMHGHLPKKGVCRVFKITNRCGDGFKQYPMWCSNNLSWQECKAEPAVCRQLHSTNHYGYPAHFDLQDFHLQISKGLNWDNVEVTFEPVPCAGKWKGEDWNCQCDAMQGHHHNGSSPPHRPKDDNVGKHPDGATPTPTPTPPSDRCGKEWEQCGGLSLQGGECCQEGCYCEHLGERANKHYSHQCVPSHWKGCKYSADNAGGQPRGTMPKPNTTSKDDNAGKHPASGRCGKEWEQCGGLSLQGGECCQKGCYCEHLGEGGNKHYSHQCVPHHWKGCKYSADNGITKKYDASLGLPVDVPHARGWSPWLLAAVSAALAPVAIIRAVIRAPTAQRSDEEEAAAELLTPH